MRQAAPATPDSRRMNGRSAALAAHPSGPTDIIRHSIEPWFANHAPVLIIWRPFSAVKIRFPEEKSGVKPICALLVGFVQRAAFKR